jgi:hypothetical protein
MPPAGTSFNSGRRPDEKASISNASNKCLSKFYSDEIKEKCTINQVRI